MKLNLILKILPIEIILALDLTTDQNVMKESCFEFLFRIFTCTLSLRRRITQIYVLQLLFDFFKFQAISYCFGELGVSSSNRASSSLQILVLIPVLNYSCSFSVGIVKSQNLTYFSQRVLFIGPLVEMNPEIWNMQVTTRFDNS